MTGKRTNSIILIVEDSPTQAEVLKYILEQNHFQTLIANNGDEAMVLIRKHRPSLVISDIIMPKVDGYELCKCVKRDQEFKKIPIILLTALSDPQDIVRGLECGADNFITKPYDEKYLLSQIESTLESRPVEENDSDQAGVTVTVGDQKYSITSDRRHILKLLLSAYEAAIYKNRELERVQDELKRLNEQLGQQLHMLEQAQVMVRDMEGKIIFWNEEDERIYGYTKEEAIGKEDPQLLKTVFPRPLDEIMNEVWQNGKWEGELVRTRKDGIRVTVMSHWRPHYDTDYRPAAVIESNTDITERKKSEEQIKQLNKSLKQRAADLETSNKELEAFSYSVSHDLRAPLRSLDGFSHLLLEDYADKLDEEGKDYLKRIRTSSQLMARLIDDILTISRIARSKINMESVNLSKLADEVEGELRRQQPARQVEFKITPGLEASGDKNLLKLVFDNLLGNAFKFTSKVDHPVIEFGMSNNGKQPVYFVRDNGAGFDSAYTDKLFKPFQRLHSSEEFPGTGIGLASVQRIINRHGGRVWAEGKKGEGATFYFTLGQ